MNFLWYRNVRISKIKSINYYMDSALILRAYLDNS